MPKILLGISSSFCANFLKGQVDFLVKHGFEVIIISGPGEEISMLAKKESAKLITIPFSQTISPLTDLFQLIHIIKILKEEKPDIVNAGNPKSGFLIMLACYLIGLKNRIFTLHGLVSDTKTGFGKWLIALTENICCNIAKLVIVVSPSLKTHAEEREILKPGKGIVIENGSCNGIDINAFSRTESVLIQAKALKTKLELKSKDIIIGFVGRLSKDKGIDILFEAFNKLAKDFHHIKLLLAGPLVQEDKFSDTSMHQLQNDERIFYVGKLIDVTPVYAITDLLVLPSYREGFGNVLIEAASMQIPVIAPDIPGCRDAVSNNINGYLFTKGDVEDLYKCIKTLLENKDQRILFGREGRNFITEKFSNSKIWSRQLEIYNSMIN